jgi:diguanylate cyclase (GGDEF)-like protein
LVHGDFTTMADAGMETRITRLLDWSARDKAWLLAVITVPLHLFYAGWVWVSLNYTDFGARFLDPTVAGQGLAYALLAALYWALVAAWGSALRYLQRDSMLLVNTVIFSYGISQLPLAFLVGMAEPMTGVILLGASITGFVLFSFWRVLAAFFISLFVLMLLSLLTVEGVLPYAPVMLEDPISRDYVSPYYVTSQFMLGVPFVTFAFVICYMLLSRWKRREAQAQRLAVTDPLTGVANRRAFLDTLEREYARAQRDQSSMAVVMLDLDHFKNTNDSHGHAAGDAVLCHAAAVLGGVVREVDSVGRLGGEEFAILLPGATASEAMDVAERCRAALCRAPVMHEGAPVDVTASLGVCGLPANTVQRASRFLELADQALYAAKDGGRNRVVCYQDSP